MTDSKQQAGQTEASARKNAQFFLEEYDDYKNNVGKIDTYQNLSKALNSRLSGLRRILDIGNGGVFDYDTNQIAEVVGLDLFLDALPKSIVFPANVRMVQGSALDIPKNLREFDAVLMVMLIHHLVGEDVSACQANVQKSFEEAYKAAKTGGMLVVMDSCVPKWFFRFEALVFKSASWIISKTMKHPAVLQYTGDRVVEMMANSGFKRIESVVIPKGRFILQFGVKFPAILTPTQPTMFIGYKD